MQYTLYSLVFGQGSCFYGQQIRKHFKIHKLPKNRYEKGIHSISSSIKEYL